MFSQLIGWLHLGLSSEVAGNDGHLVEQAHLFGDVREQSEQPFPAIAYDGLYVKP